MDNNQQSERDEQATFDLGEIKRAERAGDMAGLAASIAVSLLRLANSVERMQELAEADMTAAIEEAIEARSQERAEEMVADKTKRGFIGKK